MVAVTIAPHTKGHKTMEVFVVVITVVTIKLFWVMEHAHSVRQVYNQMHNKDTVFLFILNLPQLIPNLLQRTLNQQQLILNLLTTILLTFL